MAYQKKLGTVYELIDAIEKDEGKRISEQAIRSFIHKTGIKAVRKGKYNILEFLLARKEAIAQLQNKSLAESATTISESKLKKTLVEIEILETRRDEMRNELLGREYVCEMMQKISTIYSSTLEQFISFVSAEYHDLRAVETAERLANKTRTLLARELDEISAKNN